MSTIPGQVQSAGTDCYPPFRAWFQCQAKRSYELVVSNKNEHKKHNYYDLMLESMAVKKAPVPVMGDIHELIGKSNREKCACSS